MPLTPSPKAPPRRSKAKKLEKSQISGPYDLKHEGHIGVDFNPEDVKKVFVGEHVQSTSPMSLFLPARNHEYMLPSPTLSITSRSEKDLRASSIPFVGNAQYRPSSPPNIEAPTFDRTSEPLYDHLMNWEVENSKKKNIVHYENAETDHTYVNTLKQPKSTKTRKAPPPPPHKSMPPTPLHIPYSETSASDNNLPIWRKEKPAATSVREIFEPKISTPDRVERLSVSPAIQRPNCLAGFRPEITLDVIIPPPDLTPSQSRSNVSTPASSSGTSTKKVSVPPPITRRLAEEAQKVILSKKSVEEPSMMNPTEPNNQKMNSELDSDSAKESPVVHHTKKNHEEKSVPPNIADAPLASSSSSSSVITPIPKPRQKTTLSHVDQNDVTVVIQKNPVEEDNEDYVMPDLNSSDEGSTTDEDDFVVCRF